MNNKICVVGAGPAGLYAAKELLKKIHDTNITLFEKEKEPFGLLRWGVAPDRPEFKQLIPEFQKVLTNNRVSLCTNIEIVDWSKLQRKFDYVIAAVGSPISNHMFKYNTPNLKNIVSGLEFSAYYNEKPPHKRMYEKSTKNVVIIGFGNVALDCARILYKAVNMVDEHIPTSISEEFSNVKKISLICRKSNIWEQSCSTKELREILKLCNFKASVIYKGTMRIPPPEIRSRVRLHNIALKIENDPNSMLEFRLGEMVVDVNTDIQGRIKIQLLSGHIQYADLIIYCTGQHSIELNESSELLRVGWCLRNGKGTIADCYNDARSLASLIAK